MTGASVPALGIEPAGLLEGIVPIQHIAWSPDGAQLAGALETGRVWIWDMATQRRRPEIVHPGSSVIQVAWAHKQALLATADAGTLVLWEGTTGELLRKRDLPGRLVSVAWAMNDQRIGLALLVGSPPEQRLVISSWDLESDRLETVAENPAWDRCFTALSSDRRWLALARMDGVLETWDLGGGRLLRAFERRPREIGAVAVSPDRSVLAVAFGGEVALWNLETGEQRAPLDGGSRSIYSLAFSADAELLAGKSREGWVRLWWCKDWSEAFELPEPSVDRQEVEIAFHPSEPCLATYTRKNTALRIWSLDLEKLRRGNHRMPKTKVLFLSANPLPSQHLATERELREIQDKLGLGMLGSRFEFHARTAVRTEDMLRMLQEVKPQIVHLSGHGIEPRDRFGEARNPAREIRREVVHSGGQGSAPGGFIVEGRNWREKPVSTQSLARLFGLVSDHVECVVLNACHSDETARAIAAKIDHVIGMSGNIDDEAAVTFSIGLYLSLGNGYTIGEAHQFACAYVDLEGYSDAWRPVLFRSGEIVPLAEEKRSHHA